MNITDRMLLSALLDVVGALAHKLTGEYPMICLVDAESNVVHFTLGLGVDWFKNPLDAKCCVHTERWFQEEYPKRVEAVRKAREEEAGRLNPPSITTLPKPVTLPVG